MFYLAVKIKKMCYLTSNALVTSLCTFIQVTHVIFKDYLEQKVEGEGIFFHDPPVISALVGNQDINIFVDPGRITQVSSVSTLLSPERQLQSLGSADA